MRIVQANASELWQASRENVGKPFSAAEDLSIRRLCAQRVSVAEIAERLGRTDSAIKARIQRIGR